MGCTRLASLASCAIRLALLLIAVTATRAIAHAADCAEGVIETVAGDRRCCYSGDGGPATQAALNASQGVAVGADGSIYIADCDNRCIRKVSPAGIISTVAGNTRCWPPDEGIAAIDVGICNTFGVAVAADGTMFIAAVRRVYRVDADGLLRVVAATRRGGELGVGGHRESQVEAIVRWFQELSVRFAAPCHCSGELSREKFGQAYGNR